RGRVPSARAAVGAGAPRCRIRRLRGIAHRPTSRRIRGQLHRPFPVRSSRACGGGSMTGSILIADDEPLARRTLRAYLRDLGRRDAIHEAADVNAAVEIANREHHDLIFLDIVMPGATGLEVLEQLDYDAHVIFTTAHDQYAVTAFELGALDYVLKPFGRERLPAGAEQ